MRWRGLLGLKHKSADVAKNRLQVIIQQQRTANNNSPDYLPMMKREILEVIAKYTKINLDDVKVDLHYRDNDSVMELSVALPEGTNVHTEV
jgi:cell division topological specificity factor